MPEVIVFFSVNGSAYFHVAVNIETGRLPVVFSNCVFNKCVIASDDPESVYFIKCNFVDCDFVNCDISEFDNVVNSQSTLTK